MHFSRFAVAAFAALPSLVSAFTLGTISDPIGDVPGKCASQFNIPLMSCGLLPGKCSEACEEQLKNLSKTLKGVCNNVDDPQGLLLIALEGDLVKTLCTNGGSSNSNSGDNNSEPAPSRVASETGLLTFQPGPGKTPEPTPGNSELNFSGVVEVTSGAPVAAPTGLATDPSTPDDAENTATNPTNYLPTTLQTSAGPTSTSNSNNNNGGLFTSQEDADNAAGALRAGLMGLAVGFLAVIVNIA